MFLTTIKSNYTFNQTLKIYTQTTEKVFFFLNHFFLTATTTITAKTNTLLTSKSKLKKKRKEKRSRIKYQYPMRKKKFKAKNQGCRFPVTSNDVFFSSKREKGQI